MEQIGLPALVIGQDLSESIRTIGVTLILSCVIFQGSSEGKEDADIPIGAKRLALGTDRLSFALVRGATIAERSRVGIGSSKREEGE